MNDFFKKRRARKEMKEYLHVARHAQNMREDIADPKDLEVLRQIEAEVKACYDAGTKATEKQLEKLAEAADKVYPSENMRGIRENVEVIIVALGAAMAIRAFFFQPYKIPTGSMQPTLNGIIATAQTEADWYQKGPFKFFGWLFTGASYKEYKAKVSGPLQPMIDPKTGNTVAALTLNDKLLINIGGTIHEIPSYMSSAFSTLSIKEHYQKGDIIVSARVNAGDHILVNKMKYNFMKPERGDISVFDTRHITHKDIRPDTFYIKRMVGMPNETISIRDGRLLADGEIVRDPPIFETIANSTNYHGHAYARISAGQKAHLVGPESRLKLAEDEYLMMGDNTHNSLDGRYFGGVKREDFQGPAFFVYWPFRDHWGFVE